MIDDAIQFLTLAEVMTIHEDQVRQYGGETGVRDITLLSSALAIPQATFDGAYLQESIFHMAAAYAYHITQNHPFLDGNKRTGLVAALVFLEFNGIEVNDPGGLLYASMMKIAEGKTGKDDLIKVLISLSSSLTE